MTMDARKQRILEAIVAIYSTGGEPVAPVCWPATLTWHFPAQRSATRWPR